MANRCIRFLIPFCLFAFLAGNVFGAPVVSYTVSGTSGDWTLNFSVTNIYGVPNMDIYFFGVNLPGDTIVGSPTPNWGLYGPYLTYNLSWLDYGVSIPDMIQNGETLSGFLVRDTSLGAPTSVPWFLYLYDWTGGGGTYHGEANPLFEGRATPGSTVPEPATILLCGLGMLALAGFRKNR